MQIEHFNTMSAAEAADAVRPCADIAGWVNAVVADRPYADVEALLAHAEALASAWTVAEVEEALVDHPRVGDQSWMPGLSEVPAAGDVQDRIAAGNAAYEQRFHRVFLIRAAGRSGEEILAQLEQRLANDPTTELEVTRGQLAEIAALRLRGLLR